MKKYTSLLLIGFIPLFGYAQPIMTHTSHGFMPETANMMRAVEYVSPGEAGEQMVWDFQHALSVKDAVLVQESMSKIDSRNILITNQNNARFSYTNDAKSKIYNGYQDENLSIAFDKPIVKLTYPFTYKSAISGSFSGRITYHNSNLEYYRTGTYSTEADAMGVLVMPDGQVLKNVLRLKVVEKYVDQACSEVKVDLVKYAWYIEEYRYPVFVIFDISHSYPDGRVTTKYEAYATTANLPQAADEPVYESEEPVIEEQAVGRTTALEVEHAVYPNPYNNFLHITYTLTKPTTVNIALYSLSGQMVSELINNKVQDGIQHITYTPKYNEVTGTYYLRLQFGDKVYVRALVKN